MARSIKSPLFLSALCRGCRICPGHASVKFLTSDCKVLRSSRDLTASSSLVGRLPLLGVTRRSSLDKSVILSALAAVSVVGCLATKRSRRGGTQSSPEQSVWKPRRHPSPQYQSSTSVHGLTPSASVSSTIPVSVAQQQLLSSTARQNVEATRRKRALKVELRAQHLEADGSADGLLRRQRVRSKVTLQRYTRETDTFYRLSTFQKPTVIGGLESAELARIDRELDKQVVELYLAGREIADARMRVYGVKWYLVLTRQQLPLAMASLAGFTKQDGGASKDPATWESVVLAAAALLRSALADSNEKERRAKIDACAMMVLQFDTVSRPSDLPKLSLQSLLPPVHTAAAKSPCWTITFYPSSSRASAKNNSQDDTVTVGGSTIARPWLSQLTAAYHRLHTGETPSKSVFSISYAVYSSLFRSAMKLAGLQHLKYSLHQLRHGGASEMFLAGADPMQILQRGRWSVLTSTRRYTKQGRYLRQLHLLSRLQKTQVAKEEKYLQENLGKAVCRMPGKRKLPFPEPSRSIRPQHIEYREPIVPSSNAVWKPKALRNQPTSRRRT